MAYERVGPYVGDVPASWVAAWNMAFHAAMDELAEARGLRKRMAK